MLKHLRLISLLAVLWLTCFSGLSKTTLIDLVDEGFYSTASRQMLVTGDWITPRVGGLPFLGKPPMFLWAQAIVMKILGPTVLAARLPSALAIAVTSLLLWFWMKRRGQERAGWLAAIFYACCPMAMGMGRVAMTDALMGLWLTVTIMGASDAYHGKTGGYLWMSFGAAFATLTKGPVGVLLPMVTFVLWLIWKRNLKELRKPIWLLVIALFVVIVLPWHLAIWRAHGPEFLREYFWQHHIQRVLGRAFGHSQPFWYYVPVLICAMFPFVAFVPRAWWQAIKSRTNETLDGRALWALWAAGVLLFFSLSRSKLASYILPALPALAILVALHIDRSIKAHGAMSRVESMLIGLTGSLIGAVLLVCGVLGFGWRSHPSPVPYSAKVLSGTIGWQSGPMNEARIWYRLSPFTLLAPHALVIGMLVLISIGLMLLWRREIVRVVSVGILFCLSFAVIFSQFAMPAWSRFDIEPLWQLAETTRPSLQQGEPLVLYGIHPARTSVRYLLGDSNLITETTDVPVMERIVTQNPKGYILAVNGEPLPAVSGRVTFERSSGRWALWRFEK